VELGYEFEDQWEKVFVLDYHGIECTIVLNQPEQTILFLDEEYWSCYGRFGKTDPSSVQILL